MRGRLVDAEGVHRVDVPQWDQEVDRFLHGLGCHPKVIEACRRRNHVPTVHSYAHHYFVTMHTAPG